MTARVLAFFCPLSLAACVTTPVSVRPAVDLAIGQTGRSDGPTVTPLRLIEDSRCPVDVRCVWEGRVIVRTRVVTGMSRRTQDMILGEPVASADGTLSLTAVRPPRNESGTTASSYRFDYHFAGGL